MYVCPAVCSELYSSSTPIENLLCRHQPETAAAICFVPSVGPAQLPRHHEDCGTISIFQKDRQGKLGCFGVCIIEGQQDRFLRQALSLTNPSEPVARANSDISP